MRHRNTYVWSFSHSENSVDSKTNRCWLSVMNWMWCERGAPGRLLCCLKRANERLSEDSLPLLWLSLPCTKGLKWVTAFIGLSPNYFCHRVPDTSSYSGLSNIHPQMKRINKCICKINTPNFSLLENKNCREADARCRYVTRPGARAGLMHPSFSF